MGVHNIMLGHTLVFLLLAILHSAVAQFREADFVKFPAPDFICPEPNGRFPDAEQCDKYYICKKDVAEAVLCPEGLLFDFKVPNHEKCVYPHGVDCSGRNLIQELTPGIDPRCGAAWGYFEYFDEVQNKTDCTKYWNCDNGVAHEMPCVQSLYFDYIKGTCVRLDDMTAEQQDVCNDDNLGVKSIDGWTCPQTGAEQILTNPNPIYPHPTDCRSFFSCYFGTDPHKFGCSEGEVFDADFKRCKDPSEVPACRCYYAESWDEAGCGAGVEPYQDCTCP